MKNFNEIFPNTDLLSCNSSSVTILTYTQYTVCIVPYSLLAWSNPPCGRRLNNAGAPMRLAPPPAVPADE